MIYQTLKASQCKYGTFIDYAVVAAHSLTSHRAGVLPGPGPDLEALGEGLPAHQPRLLLLHPAEAAGG